MKNFEGSIAQVLSKSSQVYHSFCRVRKPVVLGFCPETPLLSGTLVNEMNFSLGICTLKQCQPFHNISFSPDSLLLLFRVKV